MPPDPLYIKFTFNHFTDTFTKIYVKSLPINSKIRFLNPFWISTDTGIGQGSTNITLQNSEGGVKYELI